MTAARLANLLEDSTRFSRRDIGKPVLVIVRAFWEQQEPRWQEVAMADEMQAVALAENWVSEAMNLRRQCDELTKAMPHNASKNQMQYREELLNIAERALEQLEGEK